VNAVYFYSEKAGVCISCSLTDSLQRYV